MFCFSARYSRFNNLSLCYLPANYHRLDRLDTPNDQLRILLGVCTVFLGCTSAFCAGETDVNILDKRMILTFTEYIYIYIIYIYILCIHTYMVAPNSKTSKVWIFLLFFHVFLSFFVAMRWNLPIRGKCHEYQILYYYFQASRLNKNVQM